MKYKEFKIRHNELERDVLDFLRKLIEESTITSKTHQINCIEVNVFDYTELAILHGDLMFLDDNGQHYNVYCECTLEDLIDILSKL